MTDGLYTVLVPMVNPNENESILVKLFVREGQAVKTGDVLATFETTKSTLELAADHEGFILGLNSHEGDLLKTNQHLCFIGKKADQSYPKVQPNIETTQESKPAPANLKITKPAIELAKKMGVDLNTLPRNVLITEKTIHALLTENSMDVDMTTLIIYGGGGHAKSLIDLIWAEGKYQILGVLDDGIPAGSNLLGVSVLGGGEKLPELRREGCAQAINAVGGIGNISPRLKVYEKIREAGFTCPNVIHPRSFIEPTAILGQGGQFFFNSYIGSDVQIGFGCIVNTGAIVSHDCILGDFVNLSPGAILAGAVEIGERALVGMGVTINLAVKIGAGARIGNSAVIKGDVPENGIVRAGTIWPVE
jgi:sugar O-acyltransferase (sialic acid O-acetyltransferase NeuD family)